MKTKTRKKTKEELLAAKAVEKTLMDSQKIDLLLSVNAIINRHQTFIQHGTSKSVSGKFVMDGNVLVDDLKTMWWPSKYGDITAHVRLVERDLLSTFMKFGDNCETFTLVKVTRGYVRLTNMMVELVKMIKKIGGEIYSMNGKIDHIGGVPVVFRPEIVIRIGMDRYSIYVSTEGSDVCIAGPHGTSIITSCHHIPDFIPTLKNFIDTTSTTNKLPSLEDAM